ncbi:hypothetical protein [Paenibacillus sp. P46E]|uniref:hypothetical protein n=1 Tax=Paenibacillus sp. P46E TaxID=1349436 RepID=UPI00093FDA68|nr:hypothetical protein [Paenibacillus sp. P46E]OKP99056.1 hypothetical protein A3849_07710 [Paenibacillus sp. P46E]
MINDNIENITFLYREDIIEYKEMNYGWKEFLNSLNTMSMLNFEIEEIMPSEEEFVEGSIGKGDSRAFTIDDYLWKRKRDGLNEEELPDFGEIVHD